MRSRVLGMVMVVVCLAAPVMAQGQQSGTLSGRISSSDSLALPGATVTVSSGALQGVRATATDINGLYTFPGLPPGEYVVKFEMHGMSTVERHATVSLGGLVTMDQVLSIAPVNEVVVVHGARPAPVSSPAGAFNIRSEEFARMPVARTPFGLAELAPGLTDNTPNNNQVTVGGAFAYDNVFLMDGVDINDNVLGQPNALFIEDAIQEAQVLTSGVSAEYGRFSGGVINVITKSGSNLFSGALRTNFTNPSWSVETPFEKSAGTTRASKLSPTYELTLRRADRARRRVVLRRLAHRAHDDAGHVRADAVALHQQERQYALRGEGHGHGRERPHAADDLHRQHHGPGAAGVRRQHRPGRDRRPRAR